MESPLWHLVGVLGVIGFVLAVLLALIARKLFVSSTAKEADLGERIISSLGGARNSRNARVELNRRRTVK